MDKFKLGEDVIDLLSVVFKGENPTTEEIADILDVLDTVRSSFELAWITFNQDNCSRSLAERQQSSKL